MSYTHRLTTSELIKARACADYLMEHKDQLHLDATMAAKLSSLRSDLVAESEDRQETAELPKRAVSGWPTFAAKGTANFPDAS